VDIVIYTEGLPFDGRTPFERSLGGSESAVVFMARELARRGHRMHVYCRCETPGECDGVVYHDLTDFGEFVETGECDVFICCRHLRGLTAPVRSKANVLWNHDVMVKPVAGHVMSLMYKLDRLFVLSEFQKKQFRRHLDVPEDRYIVTRNGVDLALVDESIAGVGRDPNRVIYTSRPERGLDVLLTMWPEMKERRPDLKLAIAHYENPAADAQMAEYVGTLRRFAEQLPDIEFLGPLNKRDLYRELARSALVVYPATFPEVSCISMIEAAACGTPVVTSRYCALKETVADGEGGVLVSGDPHGEDYQQGFVDAVVGLLDGPVRCQELSAAARARVEERCQWKDIAAEWEGVLRGLVERASVEGGAWDRGVEESRSRGAGGGRSRNGTCPSALQPALRDIRAPGWQTLSVCMIVKDAQGTLYRCLDRVKPIADEIIVCDTGSTDHTIEIAREYTDQVHEIPWEDDFSIARNRSIEKATGDWILWLDADEQLVGGDQLTKYLRDNMYNGYVIRQHHHAVDADFKPDVPVRLFRNHLGIRFFGCVHEHPESALNDGVKPAVILSDVHIVHDGYVTEAIRRKRFLRNLPMVMKDRKLNPTRRLGLVFLARDYIHLARYELERTRGQMTDRGRKYLGRAAAIHREHFADPADPLHSYSFPLYQSALELMGEGFELGYFIALSGEPMRDLGAQPVQRLRVADEGEAREFLGRHLGELLKEAQTDEEFPFEGAA
jgi:glycosyltransferase involved in cell wall biosynthesis